ncbi:MAG: hypothetical protein U0R50_08880 [Gaiellales bacterium]
MPTIRVLFATVTLALAVAFATTDARSSATCATPARGDRPAGVAGRSIRLLYTYPVDGANRAAERADAMAADAATITAWWRTQDPAREPRFDVWESPCGATPDIGVLQLPDTAATLRPIAGRAARIADAVIGASDGSPYKKYLVYYDGPADTSVCGQGSGQPDGPATAIVFLGSCDAVPKALIAAHELLHALGGAPVTGPPNECPSSPQHVCDSATDILSPYAPRRPLATTTLDVGRDDYYGHSGKWDDLQDSRWLRRVGRQVPITVEVAGEGKVVSEVPGVACRGRCVTSWDVGEFVVLEAVPGPGQRLVDWQGACDGAENCTFDANGSTRVKAVFAPAKVGLRLAVRGGGTIVAPGGSCTKLCRQTVSSTGQVTLRAVAQTGWRFRGWEAACSGSRSACTLSTRRPLTATAVFVRVRRDR